MMKIQIIIYKLSKDVVKEQKNPIKDLETEELVLKGMFSENPELIKEPRKINNMFEKCDDLENTLKIYESFDDVLIDHPLFKRKAVQNCCNGRTKRSGGFKWFYVNPLTKERIPKNKI